MQAAILTAHSRRSQPWLNRIRPLTEMVTHYAPDSTRATDALTKQVNSPVRVWLGWSTSHRRSVLFQHWYQHNAVAESQALTVTDIWENNSSWQFHFKNELLWTTNRNLMSNGQRTALDTLWTVYVKMGVWVIDFFYLSLSHTHTHNQGMWWWVSEICFTYKARIDSGI